MRQVIISVWSASWLWIGALGVAKAQEPPPEPPGSVAESAPVTSTPSDSMRANKYLAYDMYRRDELERGIPPTRKALIATSVVFGVGLALVIPAWAGDHCVTVVGSNGDQIRCDRAGKALLGTGAPLAWGGSIGMLVSGIMLGVRKGKLRRLNQRIIMTSERRLRWDPSTSQFLF